jgi:SAM-dependent methyltransferase
MAEMFANAAAYERMMGRWSSRLALQFLDFAGIQGGGKILDVGCGTGSLIQAVADRVAGVDITGIDPARPFIDYCHQRFTGPRFGFDCGNGMDLPYPQNSFDHSLSLLVFMFIPQPDKAAAEMRRVTRPGGTVAACTWESGDGLGGLQMTTVFWEEAEKLDPAASAMAERPRHCNREGQLSALWRAAGLAAVEETALEFRTEHVSFDDYWSPFLGGIGPHGVYVSQLSPERRDSLREALRKRLLGDRADGPISLGAKALAVRGIAADR